MYRQHITVKGGEEDTLWSLCIEEGDIRVSAGDGFKSLRREGGRPDQVQGKKNPQYL